MRMQYSLCDTAVHESIMKISEILSVIIGVQQSLCDNHFSELVPEAVHRRDRLLCLLGHRHQRNTLGLHNIHHESGRHFWGDCYRVRSGANARVLRRRHVRRSGDVEHLRRRLHIVDWDHPLDHRRLRQRRLRPASESGRQRQHQAPQRQRQWFGQAAVCHFRYRHAPAPGETARDRHCPLMSCARSAAWMLRARLRTRIGRSPSAGGSRADDTAGTVTGAVPEGTNLKVPAAAAGRAVCDVQRRTTCDAQRGAPLQGVTCDAQPCNAQLAVCDAQCRHCSGCRPPAALRVTRWTSSLWARSRLRSSSCTSGSAAITPSISLRI